MAVLTSSGITFGDSTTQTTAAVGGFSNMVVITSTNASYSIPATKIKVTVVGAGGGSGGGGYGCNIGSAGQFGEILEYVQPIQPSV